MIETLSTHINAKLLLKILKNPVGIHMYKYLPRVGSAGTKLCLRLDHGHMA